jgi:hypothetical protein
MRKMNNALEDLKNELQAVSTPLEKVCHVGVEILLK